MSKVSERYLEARRAEILDAARRVLVDRGYAAATMQDIATAAGLSAGSIYNYFPSKAALLAAVAIECSVADRLMFAAHAERSTSPALALLAVGAHVGELLPTEAERESTIVRLESYLAAARDAELRAAVASALMDSRDALAALLVAARDHGELAPEVDPDALAVLLHAAVAGLLTLRVPLGDAVEVGGAWELLTRLVSGLMRSPLEGGTPPHDERN